MNKDSICQKRLIKWIDEFDINKIPLDTRKKWHRSYTRAYLSSLDADYEDPSKYLKESDSNTTNDIIVKPVIEVVERLISTYNMSKEQFVVTTFNGVYAAKIYDIPVFSTNPFGVIIPNDNINIGIIDSEMKKDGYYRIRTNKKKDNDGMEWYILGYNPIKQLNIYDAIKYFHWLHFSPSIFRKKIQSNGLELSDGNEMFKYYESRVYLYIYDLRYQISDDFKKIMHSKAKSIKNEHPEWDGTFDEFEIIKTKMPKNTEMFFDPNVSSCVYIKEEIPSKALKLKNTNIVF